MFLNLVLTLGASYTAMFGLCKSLIVVCALFCINFICQ